MSVNLQGDALITYQVIKSKPLYELNKDKGELELKSKVSGLNAAEKSDLIQKIEEDIRSLNETLEKSTGLGKSLAQRDIEDLTDKKFHIEFIINEQLNHTKCSGKLNEAFKKEIKKPESKAEIDQENRADEAKAKAFKRANEDHPKSKQAFDKLHAFLSENKEFNPQTHMVRDDLEVISLKEIFPTSLSHIFKFDTLALGRGNKPEIDISRFSKLAVKEKLRALEKEAKPYLDTYHKTEVEEFSKEHFNPISNQLLTKRLVLEQSKFWKIFVEPEYTGL